ncbi:hypothetical protein [Corynebacterium mastitidis]|uniref:hypothetical protein n=1 Tax=Corynebacterium mastitidis TaxID=161890 RepID=UPI00254A993F|nr:hypothetical protein [Corynebacterium mastitidis]MDK8451542.1 hypothetical protein [Corynebacterium mastitidis]
MRGWSTRVAVGLTLTTVVFLSGSYRALTEHGGPAAVAFVAATALLPLASWLLRGLSRWPYICALYAGYVALAGLHTLVLRPGEWSWSALSWKLTLLGALVLGTAMERASEGRSARESLEP